MLPLFDEPSTFDREGLRDRLQALAKREILIGTSSWKYPGWLGQIYTPDRYLTRGRFSEKRFQAECLGEYAETFPIVCGDFSFYLFPEQQYWDRLFASAPRTLRYAFKVPEDITVKMFPEHPRYGPRRGEYNETFLNAALFRAEFIDRLAPYRSQVAVLIFEFGTFSENCYESVLPFIAELEAFLASLPPGWRYAVEVRNQEYLTPEYFACLHRHGVAHVFNAWTRMPDLGQQIQLPKSFTADFTVVRALLRRGRPYEQAVESLSPYKEVRDENPGAREAMRTVINRARERDEPAYIFVNNRLEGNAPATIESLIG